MLYRRGFEVEDGVVGQQRFTTTTTRHRLPNVRGAFVAGGKLFFATTTRQPVRGDLEPGRAHHRSTGTLAQITDGRHRLDLAGAVPAPGDAAAGQRAADRQRDGLLRPARLHASTAPASTDPENGPLTYDWDFGDGTAHGTGATTTHTYADAGDRAVTLIVTDNKGATNSVTRTASPTSDADSISFVASSNNNGNRTNHSITVPAGTQVGDTLLLFFAANSTGPVYAGPAGWTQVLTQNGSSSVGKLYSQDGDGRRPRLDGHRDQQDTTDGTRVLRQVRH